MKNKRADKKGFLALVKTRKTTYEFSSKTIDKDTILSLLEVARWSPSCSNSQPWHFIIIQDKKKINQLMRTVNYGAFHTNPAVLVAIALQTNRCVDKTQLCYGGNDRVPQDSIMSTGIAGYTITLAAQEKCIDSCLLTPKQTSLKKILDIKKNDIVPLLVGLGYEKKGAYHKKRDRRELSEIVSYGTFKNKKPNK